MKILIADDDTTSRLLLAATLKKLGHTVTAVEDGEQALRRWREERPDLLISDWMMPGLDGLELCRLIRKEPALQYTYVVLLTSLAGKGRYLDGMQAGADDFINKPYDEEHLAARLHVAGRILALHETLRIEATHDRLTGLWNRAAILDCLQRHLDGEAGGEACIGIILGDLDRFKSVNDTHGHAAGDSVLQQCAQRMQAGMGPGDYVGRYGGEEFLAVVPGCGPGHVAAVADGIRAAIAATPMQTPAGPLNVTASFGVAQMRASANADAGRLIAAADAALYRAKLAGRDRVETAPCAAGDTGAAVPES